MPRPRLRNQLRTTPVADPTRPCRRIGSKRKGSLGKHPVSERNPDPLCSLPIFSSRIDSRPTEHRPFGKVKGKASAQDFKERSLQLLRLTSSPLRSAEPHERTGSSDLCGGRIRLPRGAVQSFHAQSGLSRV